MIPIFDDASFIAGVTGFMQMLSAEVNRAQEQRHPDHMPIKAIATSSGADLAEVVARTDATVFECDACASDEVRAEAAALFDDLRDWSDVWPELSYVEQLQAERSLNSSLASLERHGLRGYRAHRVDALGAAPAGAAPIPYGIA